MRIDNAPNTKFDDILDRARQILRMGETSPCSLPCLSTATMCLLLAISEHEDFLPHDRATRISTMHELDPRLAPSHDPSQKDLAIKPWPAPATLLYRGYIYSIIYLNILHATFPRLIPRGIALSIFAFISFHFIQTSAFFRQSSVFGIILIPSLSWERWTSDACYLSAFYSIEYLNLLLACVFSTLWVYPIILGDGGGGYYIEA